MKIPYNDLIKLGLSVLLILCLFDLSFGEYEIIRFVLIASFAWLAISENDPKKKGLRFLYIVFIVLFNPFFKLEIGKDLWHFVDIIVAALLLLNLIAFSYFSRYIFNYLRKIEYKKLWLIIFSKKVISLLTKLAVGIVVIYVLLAGYKQYQKNQKNKEIAIKQHIQDSLTQIRRHNDSVTQVKLEVAQAIENKRNDSINAIGRRVHCNGITALSEFYKHMNFYYPTWKIKGHPKVNTNGDCSFQISAVIYNEKYGDYSTDALIVQISLWGVGYGQSSFNIIEKPALFDE